MSERLIPVTLYINGKEYKEEVASTRRLLDYLRDDLLIKSVKEGCGVGDCGACTVLCNDVPIHSCLTLVAEVDGCQITTVEGLMKDGEMSDLQAAFVKHGAVQCGFCTSGMILTAEGMLRENPDLTLEDIKRGLAGNLCRCTGYQKIFEAILEVAKERKADK